MQATQVTTSLRVKAWANAGCLPEVKECLKTLPLDAIGGWSAAATAFARVGDTAA